MREDWVIVKLGEFAAHEKGKKPKNQKAKQDEVFKFPYVNIEAFEKGIIETYTDGEKCNFCYEDDFLMVWDGSRSGLVGKGMNGALGSTLVRINFPGIENDYAYHFLSSKYQEINTRAKGSGTPHVDPYLLWNYNFPICSLSEQRAIVSKIETLFSDFDKGIEDLNKAKDQLKIYRQAVLKKAFEGGLTQMWRQSNKYDLSEFLNELKVSKENAIKNKLIAKGEYFPDYKGEDLTFKTPKNWLNLPWKTLCSNNKYSMKRGPFGSALKKEYFIEKGIPVYEQGPAINDEPYRHMYFISNEKFDELKAFETNAGDMIISCSGVTLGRICLLPDDADKGVINQALLKVDMDEKIMLKEYFIYLFRSGSFQKLIFEKSLGTAMPNMVGMTELKEIPIPVPPIEEQKQILKEIESRLSVCEKVEQSIQESLEKAKALRQSILKKAFEGTLLTKEEIEKCKAEKDYEPAAVLLEKIRKEKKK